MPVPRWNWHFRGFIVRDRLFFQTFVMLILPLVEYWIWVLLCIIPLTVAPEVPTAGDSLNPTSLLDSFRDHYAQFQAVVAQVHAEPTDPFLLQLLGEDLNQFSQLAREVRAWFSCYFISNVMLSISMQPYLNPMKPKFYKIVSK